MAVYTDSGITVESNPSPAVTPTGSSGCTLTFAAATPADTAGITNYTYVYASQLGATATNPGVVYFLVATRPAGTTTHSDASLPFLLDATGALTQLTWQAGGTPSNQQVQSPYVYDHSPAPNAYVVANALMGANASSLNSNGNQARGGILLAAYGSTLYASRSGMPWYFPLINAEVLDDTIEAIVVNQSSAYVLTQSSAYLVTGYDDANLSVTRTQAKHGCAPRCGQGAILTPHGIVYPSPLGLAVLDATGNGTVGTTSRILTQDFLSYGFTKSTSGAVGYGAYQDDVYIYAEGPGLIYLFDFAAWPRVRTTRFDGVTLPIVALARVHPFSNSSAKGLYALINNGNGTLSPCPWWPRLGFQLSPAASPAPWSHLTGALTAGTTNKKKRFTRFWLGSNTAADVTLTFTCSNWDGSLAGQLVNVTASSWLPSTFTGDYMTVNIISSVGTDVFDSLRIEGEVYE